MLCALVPALWAALVARVFRARDSKKARFEAVHKPPSDYSI